MAKVETTIKAGAIEISFEAPAELVRQVATSAGILMSQLITILVPPPREPAPKFGDG